VTIEGNAIVIILKTGKIYRYGGRGSMAIEPQ
jgi:hypothetical protein